jgi:urease beta subunit
VRLKPAAAAGVCLKPAAGAEVRLKPAAGAGVRLKPAVGAGVRLKPAAGAGVHLKPGDHTEGVLRLCYLESRRTGHSSDLDIVRLAEMQLEGKLSEHGVVYREAHLNKGPLAKPD